MEKATIDYEIRTDRKPDVFQEYAKRIAEAQMAKTKEEVKGEN